MSAYMKLRANSAMYKVANFLFDEYKVRESRFEVDADGTPVKWIAIAHDGQKITFRKLNRGWEFWAKHQHASKMRNARIATLKEILKHYKKDVQQYSEWADDCPNP